MIIGVGIRETGMNHYNLKQMLAEIAEDEEYGNHAKHLSQEEIIRKINAMRKERRKRRRRFTDA